MDQNELVFVRDRLGLYIADAISLGFDNQGIDLADFTRDKNMVPATERIVDLTTFPRREKQMSRWLERLG